MNFMFSGHLSNRIPEINDISKAHNDFVDKAAKNGYTAAAESHNHLFQMKCSYFIEKESLTLHLYVHIPLLNKKK